MTYTSIKKEIDELKRGKGCKCSKNKLSTEISKAYADYLVKGNIEMAKKTIALRHKMYGL